MFNLNGKNALITGASGGIGRAIAETLHASGARLTISGTRMEPLEELANSLGDRIVSLGSRSSPEKSNLILRVKEARESYQWYDSVTDEIFGS